MPFDSFGLDLGVKGLLSQAAAAAATQIRIHSADPGNANSNQISYTGLADPGGVDVAAGGWTFNADGTAAPTANVDFPTPPAGFVTVAASWISLWRGNNRVGKFEIVDAGGTATTINIEAQRIPRLTPANFVFTVPAA